MAAEKRERREKNGESSAEETRRELAEAGHLSPEDERILAREGTGRMTVEEAGHLGGEIGGQKVRRLIEEGKQLESEQGKETGAAGPSRGRGRESR